MAALDEDQKGSSKRNWLHYLKKELKVDDINNDKMIMPIRLESYRGCDET